MARRAGGKLSTSRRAFFAPPRRRVRRSGIASAALISANSAAAPSLVAATGYDSVGGNPILLLSPAMTMEIAESVESIATSSEILIVDDDRSSCEILAKILALRGYRVDVAYDGPTALDLVQKKTYGLALIDYRMPGMDGVELYRRIRQLRPDVVGVFVTGFPTIDTVYPAIAVGVKRVIAKPAGSSELIQVIEEFVGRPR